MSKYSDLIDKLNILYEEGNIDYNSYSDLFDNITAYFEGSVVNNIPRSEAKKAGNYGKNKLNDEEALRHYQKRLYRATSGSPLTYANRKLDEYLAPTEYDKEQAAKRGGDGRKFKVTGSDVKKIAKSKGKDLGKAIYRGAARDTIYDVAKQQATTFGAYSVPGIGGSIGSLNQNLGTYSRLTKVISDTLKKIDNSNLSENDKKILKTKARLLSQRWLKQHSVTKQIEDKYMIDLSKSLNRELFGKTSSLSEIKKLTKDMQSEAKSNAQEAKDAVSNGAKKAITREIPNKEGVKALGKSVIRTVKSVPEIAYHGTKIAGKKINSKYSKNDTITSPNLVPNPV